MKKLKLLGLLAMMLVVATVLCACGNLGNLNKIFNEAYNTDAKLFKEAAEIEEHYKKFGDRLPKELVNQLNNLKANLEK